MRCPAEGASRSTLGSANGKIAARRALNDPGKLRDPSKDKFGENEPVRRIMQSEQGGTYQRLARVGTLRDTDKDARDNRNLRNRPESHKGDILSSKARRYGIATCVKKGMIKHSCEMEQKQSTYASEANRNCANHGESDMQGTTTAETLTSRNLS